MTADLAISPLESDYQRCVERWPTCRWDREAYFRHRAGRSSAHPLDLYLAGAAAYYTINAWDLLERELGPKVRQILQRQPGADAAAEDLWAEARARLMSPDPDPPPADGTRPARIVRYRGAVALLSYLVVIAKRIAIDRHRRQLKPHVSPNSIEIDRFADTRGAAPCARAADAEVLSQIRQFIARAFARLSGEQQFLLSMVYRDGATQRAAGAMLGWSESRTSRALAAAIDRLRESADLSDGDWSAAIKTAWAECLDECLNRLAENPAAIRVEKEQMRGSAPLRP